ncbi:sensor histidine kinase [Labrys wisconsinensis]|uniref:histidine kinase n=1 Tax=Labrys wisconsinensis TaxID=425677 RepID=A0ABU0JJV3_9HYPH|nr:HAMP domain-containing sensor histidine kinase [Labrys wisconsinensis]MDQ0473683.1 signal transduction histidine kinase [Labrys wisconsinensis]
MRPFDLSPFKTSIFRLTAVYVLLFALSVGVLFTVVGYVTRNSMRSQISATVEREAAALAQEYGQADGSAATEIVKRRLQRGAFSYFLLQGADGRLIAGNISPVSIEPGLHDVLVHRRRDAAHPERGEEAEARPAIAFGIRLGDGSFAVVANDAERIAQVESAIGTAFAAGGSVSALLAILGGILLSAGFVRRIDAVNRTARDFMAGQFDARVPVAGRKDEIGQLAANLNAMFDRLQQAMESLKQLSGDVAHDLRTPLSRLRQTLEVARATATSTAEFRAAIEAAIAEAEAILDTFSALLRIAQIESGSRRRGFAPVDLSALTRLVAETYGVVAEDAGHALTASIEDGVRVQGDRELLLQLCSNVVENAIRHTPAGSVIALRLAHEGRDAVLVFADTGPGIPEQDYGRIFRRFYRLEASRTTPGNGLGLAIVAAIAELHGAAITLSDNGPGLALSIRFPAPDHGGLARRS